MVISAAGHKRMKRAQERVAKRRELERELAALLNRYRQENASNTPDYVLASYLIWCLKAFNHATRMRSKWYGIDDVINIKQRVLYEKTVRGKRV